MRCLQKSFSFVIAALLSLVCVGVSFSGEKFTDAEKLRVIYDMYEGYRKSFPEVQDVTPQRAMKLMRAQKAVFVDIREPEEQQISMLPGAVTEEELKKNIDNYEKYILIAYCTISYRSGKLARKLRKQGIIMSNLKGGLLAWVHEGGKVYDVFGETKRIHVYGKKWNYPPNDYEAIW